VPLNFTFFWKNLIMVFYEFKTYWTTPIYDGTYSKVNTYQDIERYTDQVDEKNPTRYKTRLCEKYTFFFKGHGQGKPIFCMINRQSFDYDPETKKTSNTNYNDIRIEDPKKTAEQYCNLNQEISHLNGSLGINRYTTLPLTLTYSDGTNNPSKIIKQYSDIIPS